MSDIKEELSDYSHDVLIKMIEDIRSSAVFNFPAFVGRIDEKIFERSRKLERLEHGTQVDTPDGPGKYWIYVKGTGKHLVTFKDGGSQHYDISHIKIIE